ncbi:MAG: glycosyltransferase family 2 protein [Myxococcota bacterium]|nr:glycosyltransferase family 2 protein [Myxococcota bacterium]MEC9389413.1 glycosyltransferase family 2 protein [Myxococcota bacterium]
MSESQPTVSLVVPVYNEVENVGPLVEAIDAALAGRSYEVVLVNDGSTDGSGDALNTLAANSAHIRVIHFVRNYGQTAALTAGIRHSTAPIIVTLDADLQNDPADIPGMLEHLGEADVVCGWRKDRKDPWLSRTLPSRMANALISRLSNVPLHDYGCTLRVYKREYLEQIPLYGEMHRFIPIYVTWAGAKLIEVPVRHHPRTRGESKYGLSRVFKVLLDLTTVKFLRDFFVTPIYFFGWLGFLFVSLGLITGVAALGFWTVWSHTMLAVCLTVISPMLAIFGVVEITLGIIAEVLIRMHYEIQGRAPYRIGSAVGIAPSPEER